MTVGLTLCSGIGAPEVAAPWVDWRLAAEVEAFPRAVLDARHGYRLPGDQNQGEPLLWGDMREVTPDLLRLRGLPLPDLVVAGTPCQAFSVAGLRGGTADARGNLTLAFVELLHGLVAARPDGRLAVLWENVPGVLSDRGNAFGCFLGGVVGAVDAVLPSPCPAIGRSTDHWRWHPGGRDPILDDDGEPTGESIIVEPHHRLSWPSEGMVEGPRARAAWAVLDAQWFGVAQRRRRVFVVIDFGGALDPAAVLLEPDRLRGDPPSRPGAGQVAPTVPSRGSAGGGLGTDFDLDGGLIARPLRAQAQPAHRDDADTYVAQALRGEGFDASEDGTGRGTPIVPVAFGGNDTRGPIEVATAVNAHGGPHGRLDFESETFVVAPPLEPVAYRLHAQGSTAMQGEGTARAADPVEVARCLDSSGGFTAAQGGNVVAQPVPFQETADCLFAAMGTKWNGNAAADNGSHYVAQPIAFSAKDHGADASTDLSPTLRAGGHDGSHANVGVGPAVAQGWAVRRLTPEECEALQGFPRSFTAIPWRGRAETPDGPRYKALGNSMAVPVVRWILEGMRASMAQHGGAS